MYPGLYDNESDESDKAEVDCEYTSTGLCDDCTLPVNDICPYEDDFKKTHKFQKTRTLV